MSVRRQIYYLLNRTKGYFLDYRNSSYSIQFVLSIFYIKIDRKHFPVTLQTIINTAVCKERIIKGNFTIGNTSALSIYIYILLLAKVSILKFPLAIFIIVKIISNDSLLEYSRYIQDLNSNLISLSK